MDDSDERIVPTLGSKLIERADEVYSPRLKMNFRSLYEMYVAHVMKDWGFLFAYETWAFYLSNGKIYIPDFLVLGHECFVEVKGKWSIGGKKKLGVFREDFPHLELLVLPWTLRHDFFPEETR